MSDPSGSQRERDLVNQLEAAGHGVIRSPGSGGGTDLPRPDIFYCVNGETYVAGEMKYGKNGTKRKYIQSEEIAGLHEFCKDWGAIPVAIHRWAQDTNFYVIPLNSLTESDLTRTGNLSLSKKNRKDSMEISQYNSILAKS